MFAKKIINFFKRIFRDDSLDFLEVGDLIYINRYRNKKEKKELEEGHETGPAIVIKIDDENVYFLLCSSQNKYNISEVLRPKILKKEYEGLKKDTYVDASNVELLTPKMLLKKLDIISEEDMDRIFKALFFSKKNLGEPIPDDLELDYQYSVGDIIVFNFSRYYIIGTDDNGLQALKIFSNTAAKGKRKIQIGDKGYAIDYSNVYTIDYNSDIALVDCADKNMQNIISSHYLKQKRQEEEEKRLKQSIKPKRLKQSIKPSRGHLIRYDNTLYYIYGQEKTNFLLHVVYPYTENRMGYKISIDNKTYLTFFDKFTTSMDEIANAEIVGAVSEAEANEIKDLKKSTKGKKQNQYGNGNTQLHKEIGPKCVLVEPISGDEYVVIYRYNNVIRYVPLKNLDIYFEDTIKNGQAFNFSISRYMSNSEFRKIIDNHSYGNYARRKKR